ncbi:MAG: UPF0149 family protein [Leptothrix sp. (in: b-proteobacteria)]
MKHPQYNPALDTEALSEVEQDELERMLQATPSDEAMDLECLDGYLTGLLVAPTLPEIEVWLPRVWGGTDIDAAPFASGKKVKHCVQLVLRHMASIDRQLKAGADAIEPIFSIAEVGEDEEQVDAEIWCIGFLQAAALTPDSWDRLFDDPALSDALAPIVLLGADPASLSEAEQALIATPDARDGLSRSVPESIAALHAHVHPQWHVETPAQPTAADADDTPA